MKILHVCNRFYPGIGGVETHILELSKKFIKNGESVSIVCSNLVGINSKERFSDKKGVIEGISYERLKGFRIFGVDATTFIPYLPVFLFKNINKYDIVHVHSYGYFTSWAPILICRMLNKKVIYTPYYADETVLPDIVKKIFDFLFAGWSFRSATRIVALTNIERNILIKRFNITPEKISVIPTGIEVSDYTDVALTDNEKVAVLERHGINNKKRNIVIIARIAKNKGHIYLLQAFEKVTGCNLIIIGKDWGEKKNLEKYINEHAIENIYFLENIDNIEKNLILKIADMLILPSLGGESFGIVLLEAMASGVPVIASNVGGVSDIIIPDKNGYIFQAGNKDELYEKIKIVLQDKDIQATKAFCRNFTYNYDWYMIYKQTHDLYNKVLNNKTSD